MLAYRSRSRALLRFGLCLVAVVGGLLLLELAYLFFQNLHLRPESIALELDHHLQRGRAARGLGLRSGLKKGIERLMYRNTHQTEQRRDAEIVGIEIQTQIDVGEPNLVFHAGFMPAFEFLDGGLVSTQVFAQLAEIFQQLIFLLHNALVMHSVEIALFSELVPCGSRLNFGKGSRILGGR